MLMSLPEQVGFVLLMEVNKNVCDAGTRAERRASRQTDMSCSKRAPDELLVRAICRAERHFEVSTSPLSRDSKQLSVRFQYTVFPYSAETELMILSTRRVP